VTSVAVSGSVPPNVAVAVGGPVTAGGGGAGTVVNLKTDGSDQTATLQAAINTAMGAGANDWLILNHNGAAVILGQLTFPNDGASPPNQRALRISGLACNANSNPIIPTSGTILDLRYPGTVSAAKIDTRGAGQLVLEHLALVDSAEGNTPFLHTTNTTVKLTDCFVVGKNKATSTANVTQDGLILGGTTANADGTFAGGFQGYGTVIRDCYFHNLRDCIKGQAWANGISIHDNTFWASNGGDASHGAIHFQGGVTAVQGNYLSGNLIEIPNYINAIFLEQCSGCSLIANHFYDDSAASQYYVHCGAGSSFNLVMQAQYNTGGGRVGLYEDAAVAGTNVFITSCQNDAWRMSNNPIHSAAGGNTMADITLTNGVHLDATTILDTTAGHDLHLSYFTGTGVTHFHAGSAVDTLLVNNHGQLQTVAANEATGAGNAALGSANCPAVTPTAVYRWEKITLSDGSQGYFPVWK
jgi:hypothetical protein